MPKMNVKILKDKNESKVISIVKKYTHESIFEIRRNIDRERYVLACDYYETEELKDALEELKSAGASLKLFQDDREVSRQYLDNIIKTYEDIEKE